MSILDLATGNGHHHDMHNVTGNVLHLQTLYSMGWHVMAGLTQQVRCPGDDPLVLTYIVHGMRQAVIVCSPKHAAHL